MGWGESLDDGPRSGRELLENVADAVKIARNLRYEKVGAFDDVTTPELENVRSGLHAISYSCKEGARKIDRVLAARAASANRVPTAERTALEILEDPAVEPGVIELRDGDRVVARIVDVGEPE